jgi:hypothetical protein
MLTEACQGTLGAGGELHERMQASEINTTGAMCTCCLLMS